MSFYFDRRMECVIAVGSIKNWHNSTKAVIYIGLLKTISKNLATFLKLIDYTFLRKRPIICIFYIENIFITLKLLT